MNWVGLVSSFLGAGAGYFGGREQNKSNERISRDQMNFQERMSSTAFQRSRDDMEKAGLNPMIMASQGGASSPGGAGIPAVNEIQPAANSAKEIAMAAASIRNMGEDTKLKEAQRNSAIATEKNIKQQTKNIGHQEQGEKTKSKLYKRFELGATTLDKKLKKVRQKFLPKNYKEHKKSRTKSRTKEIEDFKKTYKQKVKEFKKRRRIQKRTIEWERKKKKDWINRK